MESSGVETNERGIQLQIRLCDAGAAEEVDVFLVLGEVVLEAFEGCEDGLGCGGVGGGGGCETGLVDGGCEGGGYPGAEFVDLGAEVWWVEVEYSLRGVGGWEEVVEGGGEHAHYFLAFVVDDLFRFLIPEHGHGVFTLVVSVGFEVELREEFAAVEVVGRAARVLGIGGGEAPSAWSLGVGFYDADGEERLEALEGAGEVSAVGVGAEGADVEMVAGRGGGEEGSAELVMPAAVIAWRVIDGHKRMIDGHNVELTSEWAGGK